jgi:hypothetical protein
VGTAESSLGGKLLDIAYSGPARDIEVEGFIAACPVETLEFGTTGGGVTSPAGVLTRTTDLSFLITDEWRAALRCSHRVLPVKAPRILDQALIFGFPNQEVSNLKTEPGVCKDILCFHRISPECRAPGKVFHSSRELDPSTFAFDSPLHPIRPDELSCSCRLSCWR